MKKIFALIILSIVMTATQASELKPEDYFNTFSQKTILQKDKTIESLAWAGLSDPRIFDLLEKDLLDNYKTADSKNLLDALSWAAKGLAFSGNDKYRSTLSTVADQAGHKKLRKYAGQSLQMLDDYKKWNPVINANHADYTAAYPSEKQRFKNMLQSGEHELIRIAAKRIHYAGHYDQDLLDIAADTLEDQYPKVNDSLSVDAVAWLIKAIAGSTDPKYKALIEKIRDTAENKGVRKYAKKYVKYYE